LDEVFGPLNLPANGTANLTTSGDQIALTGAKGLWGKSLVLQLVDDTSRKACATITVCQWSSQLKSIHFMKLHVVEAKSL
jgi:hypothetical protein